MSSDGEQRQSRPFRALSVWRVWAFTRLELLQDDVDSVPAKRRSDPHYEIAKERLEEAKEAINARYGWAFPTLFYSGARIEQAWACLHAAERALVMVLGKKTLRARLPIYRAAVRLHLDSGHEEREAALKDLADGSTPDRKRVWAILALAHRESDEVQRNVRAFRNALLIFSFFLGVALLVVAVVHIIDTSLISLCASKEPRLKGDVCPNGGTKPGHFDVAEIELIGALGGLLAAIIPLARAKRLVGPYGLLLGSSFLKMFTGAATALVGVLLLQKGVLVGLDSQPGSTVLAYAAFFGLVQQVLTRLVDQRAKDLAETTPATGKTG